MENRKLVYLENDIGMCYLSNNDDMQEYQLLDANDNIIIESSWFINMSVLVHMAIIPLTTFIIVMT